MITFISRKNSNKMKAFILTLLATLSVAFLANAQRVVQCDYSYDDDDDHCHILGLQLDRVNPAFVPQARDNSLVTELYFENLDGKFNSIPALDGSFCSVFPNLEAIIVRSAGVTEILSGAFDNCVNLQRVGFVGNSISVYPRNLFQKTPGVTMVQLVDNELKEIYPELLAPLPNLLHLGVANNQLTVFPAETVRNNKALISLDLRVNQIGDLDIAGIRANCPELVNFFFD